MNLSKSNAAPAPDPDATHLRKLAATMLIEGQDTAAAKLQSIADRLDDAAARLAHDVDKTTAWDRFMERFRGL